MKLNSRARAAQIIARIIDESINLDEALADAFAKDDNDRGFIQELCYGTLRYYWHLDFIATQLLQKPFGKKDTDLHALILIGLYQLLYLDTPKYAALSDTVEAAKQLQKVWAAKLINAVLRNFERQKENLLAKAEKNLTAQTAHPQWLQKKIQTAYPKEWQSIIAANNLKAPLCLRVNQQKISRKEYLQKLKDKNIAAHISSLSLVGIYLEQAISVFDLPGFIEGEVSVQDEAAQLAAKLLDLKPGQHVLDACAAPGGKTAHILETESVDLVAVEFSNHRAEKIHENLQRLNLSAKVVVADAADTKNWWDKKPFDRILLDAPCSATGVIRRHPDIKLLRQSQDINDLLSKQKQLLNALWPLLKPNGIFVYATCSILPEENQQQIERFLLAHLDAKLISEQQLLPQIDGHDGFYYAVLKK